MASVNEHNPCCDNRLNPPSSLHSELVKQFISGVFQPPFCKGIPARQPVRWRGLAVKEGLWPPRPEWDSTLHTRWRTGLRGNVARQTLKSARTLGALGLSSNAIEFLTSSPPESMNWINVEIAARFGILVEQLVGETDAAGDVAQLDVPPPTEPAPALQKPPIDAIDSSSMANALARALAADAGAVPQIEEVRRFKDSVGIRGLVLRRGGDVLRLDYVLVENPVQESGEFSSPRILFFGASITGDTEGSLGEAL